MISYIVELRLLKLVFVIVSPDRHARLKQVEIMVSRLGTFGHVWAQKGTKRQFWAFLA